MERVPVSVGEQKAIVRSIGLRSDPEFSRAALGLSGRQRQVLANLFGAGPPECTGDLIKSAEAAGMYNITPERLLSNPKFRAAVEYHLQEISSPRQLLHQLSAIATSDIGDMLVDVPVVDKEGNPVLDGGGEQRKVKAVSLDIAAELDMTGLIREIEFNANTGNFKVKFYDKLQAIKMLMQFHGMIVDRQVQMKADFRGADDEIDSLLSKIAGPSGTAGNPIEIEPGGAEEA